MMITGKVMVVIDREAEVDVVVDVELLCVVHLLGYLNEDITFFFWNICIGVNHAVNNNSIYKYMK